LGSIEDENASNFFRHIAIIVEGPGESFIIEDNMGS
jgi:hypothetical protein